MKGKFLLLVLVCALVLSACGEDQGPPEPEEGVLVYACMNPQDSEVKSYVKAFNNAHEDVQIEVRDYSGEDGVQRLLVELSAGLVPDLIDLHYFGKNGYIKEYSHPIRTDPPPDELWMPYRQLVQKGYLEDLWPYIENDPDLGRDKVLLPPLEAAEVNGGLYMLFRRARISTLMGAERVVGARYGWTFEEFMEAFSTMPPESTVLRYTVTRYEAFFKLLSFSLSRYVDWETGECFFDSEEFRNMLAFLMCFPEETDQEDQYKVAVESFWRIKEGEQMLEGIQFAIPRDIPYFNSLWRGRASFVGYPTADGRSGSFFYPAGSVTAMSSACRNKDAAWDFLRQMIKQRHTESSIFSPTGNPANIPINLHDYEMLIRAEMWYAEEMSSDFENSPYATMPWPFFDVSESDIYPAAPLSEEDLQRYEDLIYATDQLYWPDDDLADIVWESIGPYLAGDRDLEDTVALLNNRTTLYLNELR